MTGVASDEARAGRPAAQAPAGLGDPATIPNAWMPIETAPKGEQWVLVWFDHAADPYRDPIFPNILTDYATWAESGDFMDGEGICIARWFERHWESEDEYGSGFWMPPCWFAFQNGDWDVAVNPTHWMPLPSPPAAVIEARRAETGTGSVHESADPKGAAQTPSSSETNT